jgi:hypothetical protein
MDSLKMVAHLGAVATQDGLDFLGNDTASMTANLSYDLAMKGEMIWRDNSNKLHQANEASAAANKQVGQYEEDTHEAAEAYQKSIEYGYATYGDVMPDIPGVMSSEKAYYKGGSEEHAHVEEHSKH